MVEKISENDYLDMGDLFEGNSYRKVAYLCGAKSGTTALNNGFFTFYLKDKNSNILTARLFDIAEFVKAGYSVANMTNRAVEISFTANVFNNQWSLIVDTIKPYNGEFDYDLFIGRVDVMSKDWALDLMKKVEGEGYEFPDFFESYRLADMCDGRSNGILFTFIAGLKALQMCSGMPNIKMSDLIKVYGEAFKLFVATKLDMQETGFMLNSDIVESLTKFSRLLDGNNLKEEIMDTIIGLLGGKPQHLYSHIITKVVKDVMDCCQKSYQYTSMTAGATAFIGGDELLKY
jgi:hypothetical protein